MFSLFSIKACQLPQAALLNQYVETSNYTDCYRADISHKVTHASYVHAFYTTWLFKLERNILKMTLSKPSTDAQALLLAEAKLDTFSAWQVESRSEEQLLLCDISGRTRSWLMVMPETGDQAVRTRLYFGSAVTAIPGLTPGSIFRWLGFFLLIRFHKIYSVLLLHAARNRLMNIIGSE